MAYLQFVYSLWSKIYDKHIDCLYPFDRQKIINALELTNDTVIEIGVGTGLNLPFYPKNCHVVGIDLSRSMLGKARQKKSPALIKLQRADARHIPYPANYFNKGLATYVLRVSPEPQRVLQELQRVIKPNGKLVILDQFKGKSTILRIILYLYKLLVGSGKDYELSELIKNTSWKIIFSKPLGKRRNTYLVVMENLTISLPPSQSQTASFSSDK